MALGLFAQIGLLAHLYTLLVPTMGTQFAGITMGFATACGMGGRLLLARVLPPGGDRRVAAATMYGVQLGGVLLLCLAGGQQTVLILLAVALTEPKLQATIEAGIGVTTSAIEALEVNLARLGGGRINGGLKANEAASQLTKSLGMRGEFQNATAHLAAQRTYFAPGAGRLHCGLTLHSDILNALNENRAPNGAILNPHQTRWEVFITFFEANQPVPVLPRKRRLSDTRPMPPTAAPEVAVS